MLHWLLIWDIPYREAIGVSANHWGRVVAENLDTVRLKGDDEVDKDSEIKTLRIEKNTTNYDEYKWAHFQPTEMSSMQLVMIAKRQKTP
jgi:hypothetical protein